MYCTKEWTNALLVRNLRDLSKKKKTIYIEKNCRIMLLETNIGLITSLFVVRLLIVFLKHSGFNNCSFK